MIHKREHTLLFASRYHSGLLFPSLNSYLQNIQKRLLWLYVV